MLADDLLLCFRTNAKSCLTITKIFRDYERITNQRINFSESEIFFSKSASRSSINHQVCSTLGFKHGFFPFKYLGGKIVP